MSTPHNTTESISQERLLSKQPQPALDVSWPLDAQKNLNCIQIEPQPLSQSYKHNLAQEKEAIPTNANHKASRGQEWTSQEEALLLELHNQKGNRWVEIARKLNRNDNLVKNHYHSRLRKTIRKINKALNDHSISSRQLKPSIISKIIQTAQELYTATPPIAPSLPHAAFELKNLILDLSCLQEEGASAEQKEKLRDLISKVESFNCEVKEGSKKDQRAANSKYKGKQIISLLSQNQKCPMPPPPSTRRSLSFSSELEEEQQPSSNSLPSVPSPSYYYNPAMMPLAFFYPMYQQPFLFSGRQSSFSWYNGEEGEWGSTRIMGDSSSERPKQSLW